MKRKRYPNKTRKFLFLFLFLFQGLFMCILMKNCTCMQIAYLNEISATWYTITHPVPIQLIRYDPPNVDTFVFFCLSSPPFFFSGFQGERQLNLWYIARLSLCIWQNLCCLIWSWFVVRAQRVECLPFICTADLCAKRTLDCGLFSLGAHLLYISYNNINYYCAERKIKKKDINKRLFEKIVSKNIL